MEQGLGDDAFKLFSRSEVMRTHNGVLSDVIKGSADILQRNLLEPRPGQAVNSQLDRPCLQLLS